MSRISTMAALTAMMGMGTVGNVLPQSLGYQFAGGHAKPGTKGAGISMATQKRTAKKARNRKRHRAACRG